MPSNFKRARRRAFTLVDAAVAVAVTGTLVAVATIAMSGSRSADRFTTCSNRLGTIGAGNGQFALSHEDRMVGFSWKQNGANSKFPEYQALQSQSDMGAHAAQALDFLRRRGIPIPPLSTWVPQTRYSTFTLTEFENRTLADPYNVCPSDDFQNKWRRWPAAFDQGRFLPQQPEPSVANRRWPYAASYAMTMSATDLSQSDLVTPTAVGRRMTQQGNSHTTHTLPGTARLGPSPMSLVAFPSQKTHFYEEHQRHLGGVDLFFMYPQATLPILFFDGSVRIRQSADARGSWQPQTPQSGQRTSVIYVPRAWEPPLASGQPAPATEVLTDPYRWTRDGLLGWDFQK